MKLTKRMEQMKQKINKAAVIIQSDFLIKRHIYPYTWLSGSSTEVYPITCWVDGGEIVVQLGTNKKDWDKAIQRIIKQSNGLIVKGYFSKKDGSCPNTLTFLTNWSFKMN